MGASNVKWVRLGDYIEQCDERNSASINYPVIGINYICSYYAFLFIFDFPNPLSKHILQLHTFNCRINRYRFARQHEKYSRTAQ